MLNDAVTNFKEKPSALYYRTSASLMLSDMPFSQPIAGVRVGYVNEKFVANADPSVMQDSTLNLFMVASKDAGLLW